MSEKLSFHVPQKEKNMKLYPDSNFYMQIKSLFPTSLHRKLAPLTTNQKTRRPVKVEGENQNVFEWGGLHL